MNQAERLAKRKELLANRAKLEAELSAIAANERELLAACTHRSPDGSSALTGAPTAKACVYCGKVVLPKQKALWG